VEVFGLLEGHASEVFFVDRHCFHGDGVLIPSGTLRPVDYKAQSPNLSTLSGQCVVEGAFAENKQ
jgi:hypothetical protein